MENFCCGRISFGELLTLIAYKRVYLRSLQKNLAVRPHFLRKVVSHRALFLYRPKTRKFYMILGAKRVKGIPEGKFFYRDRKWTSEDKI